MRTHIDIESFSRVNLKQAGVYRYGEDESTDINVACWAVGDGPVNVWMSWDKIPQYIFDAIRPELDDGALLVDGLQCPDELRSLVQKSTIAAYNAQFERVVLNGEAGKKHDFPVIEIENTLCTMAKCAVHGLPAALEHAANAFGTYPKLKDNVNAMRYFAQPRRDGTRPTPYDEPDRFVKLVVYCVDDVKAERDLDKSIPDLTAEEEQVYFLDQRINKRGVAVDTASVENIRLLIKEYKERLAKICHTQTGYKPTQSGKIAEWVRANGYPQLKNLQAPTVIEASKDDKCPRNVKKLLKLYSVYNSKSVSKFDAMVRAVSSDGRLRGLFQYYGAGTGRWSSRIVQLQNMARPLIADPNTAIKAIRQRDIDWVRWLYDDIDPIKVFGSCTRGMLVAPKGRKLIAYDFEQIESRICAWLADAEWKLKFFREGKVKIYKVTGSAMFGVPPEEIVDKGEVQLYTASKVSELACGFQGWEGAVSRMARQMGVKLTLDAADIAGRWRTANPEQVELWGHLNDAAKHAVKNPGRAYAIPNKKIIFKVIGRWLYMRLPSGRRLAYLDPAIGESDHDPSGECFTYMGTDTSTRRWMRVDGYGGRALNNAAEGIGRDLLVSGMLNMERAGYETIMGVHDEGVFEVDDHFGSEEEAERLMTVPLKWAEGLPVKASGYIARRYRK